MFMLSPSALYYTALVFLAMGAAMLALSWNDTLREWRQLFDVRLLVRWVRDIARHVQRFSLRQLLTLLTLVAMVTLIVRIHFGTLADLDLGLWLIRGCYLAVVVLPLVVIFYSDAFGVSPRERWKQYTASKPPADRKWPEPITHHHDKSCAIRAKQSEWG